MSVKIYTGFRFKTTDVLALSRLIRPLFENTIRPLQIEQENKFLARTFAEQVDARCRKGEFKPEDARSIFYATEKELRKRQREIDASGYRDPEIDVDYTLVCIPHPTMGIIGFVISELDNAHKLLLESGIAEDFSYWNNTDPDKAVSEADWVARKKAWDEVDRDKTIARFTFKAEDPVRFRHMTDMAPYFPTLEKRIRRKATILIVHEDMKKEQPDENEWSSFWIRREMHVRDAIEAQAGEDFERYCKVAEELKSVFIADLTTLLTQ